MARKVTQRQAEAALNEVAKWLGSRGLGQELADGSILSVAPTGPDAAYRGLGPELVMEWGWLDEPAPAIILEGGPYDWAVECSWEITCALKALNIPVWCEPYSGWALCLNRED
jgi:hypothetical protein